MFRDRISYGSTDKNHGIELLRIVTMLFICILHVCNRGGVVSNISGTASPDKYRIAWFLEAVTICSVDVFGMTAGFVGYKKDIKIKRTAELWLELVFYTLTCTLLILIFAPDRMPENAWFKAAMPIMNGEYWYMTAYFGMILLSPILNAAVRNMSIRLLGAVIASALVFYSVIPTAADVSVFGLASGYSTLWLCVMYVTGGLIARIKKPRPAAALSAFALFVITSWLMKINGASGVLKYTSPATVAAAAALLTAFSQTDIKSEKLRAVIGFVSPSAIGVFLIHVHTFFWDILLKDAAVPFTDENAFVMGLLIIAAAVCIFTVCFAVDLLRRLIFRLLRIRPALCRLEELISEKLAPETDSAN